MRYLIGVALASLSSVAAASNEQHLGVDVSVGYSAPLTSSKSPSNDPFYKWQQEQEKAKKKQAEQYKDFMRPMKEHNNSTQGNQRLYE